ncbi:hypothetical protein [Halopelagius longus]|uniref:Uncharacterized protein n=1 Tax=Halopelagius longus TaxID=1236180 RepID=A0A1H1AVW8_9EURY|nr:hypothetical protein [Halopelagius longus]RDI70538.1 hypothetical protein DWB78_01700 [Halopelagius longus]SDQ43845.1 hypothetical protein SAMN05216278_1515 [Halopelagius longus]
MSKQSLYSQVVEEMEKDGYQLTEQALILVFGGVFGGQAYSITQEGYPLVLELFLYLFIVTIALITIGALHFLISYIRLSDAAG